MTDRLAKKLFPNPFYVLLLIASTCFIVTVLAYLIVPTVLTQDVEREAGKGGTAGALRWLEAFDRNAPMALAVQCVVMVGSGFLAMATDRWFARTDARKKTPLAAPPGGDPVPPTS